MPRPHYERIPNRHSINMERAKLFKSLKTKDIKIGRDVRKEQMQNERQQQRILMLGERRNIEVSPKTEPAMKKKSRLDLLKDWKLLKKQKENDVKKAKRPPFYVGKIQTKATGSPKLLNTVETNGMVTRSKSKPQCMPSTTKTFIKDQPLVLRQLNKVDVYALHSVKNHTFALPKAVAALQHLTIPTSPKITKSARKSTKSGFVESTSAKICKSKKMVLPKKARTNILKRISIPKKNYQANQECAVPAPEDSVEKDVIAENLQFCPSRATEYVPNNFEHLTYSPFIQKERGSSRKSTTAGRKSFKERIEEEINEENIIRLSKIQSFRLFLLNESKRLLELADFWNKYLEVHSDVPSDAEGDINAVAGKTKLLTSDKFKQFESLINKCEANDPMIKIDDLQGFHDWVSLEVEDLDKVFIQLTERRENNWLVPIEEAPVITRKPVKTGKGVKRPVVPVRSNMRELIMAKRRKMLAETNGSVVGKTSPTTPVHTARITQSSPHSPSPRPLTSFSTPRERPLTLRHRVLQRCSGLEVMAATNLARSSLSPAKSPLPSDTALCVNSDYSATKSILRQKPASPLITKSVMFSGLDPKYLLPDSDTSNDSPDIIQMMEDITPVRRSTRLARKSNFIK